MKGGVLKMAPKEYFDLVSFVPWTLIFTWCNLLILFLLIKKFLFKPVNNMLEQRQKEIDDMYNTAHSAKTNAKNMERELSERLADAKGEAGEILKNASIAARKREDEIIEEAREKAHRIVERAKEDIEQEKKKAYEEIKGDIAEISVSIAEKVVAREIRMGDHEVLISQFIDDVGEDR